MSRTQTKNILNRLATIVSKQQRDYSFNRDLSF